MKLQPAGRTLIGPGLLKVIRMEDVYEVTFYKCCKIFVE
jgi:hypothetical protein